MNSQLFLEALDEAIANKHNQHSEAQVSNLIELKKKILFDNAVNDIGKLALYFLKLLQITGYFPDI